MTWATVRRAADLRVGERVRLRTFPLIEGRYRGQAHDGLLCVRRTGRAGDVCCDMLCRPLDLERWEVAA